MTFKMKKIISLFALAAFVLVGFTSCDYDGKDDSYVTHYVSITLNEGNSYSVPVGSKFVDPGYTATEGTEDVTSSVKVSGNVDASKVGVYSLTYSADNKDGFAASVSRSVFVYDPEVSANISGTYKIIDTSGSQALFDRYPVTGNSVTLTEIAPGLYSISDYWGGLYAVTIGYGNAYSCKGYFALDKDNNITGISCSNPWSLPMTSVTGSYDSETGKVTMDVTINYHLVMVLQK